MGPVSSIGQYIREQREQAKISLRQLASATGVSNPYLSQIERGLRRPSAEILQQIAKGLRISAEVLYVQAGILEDRRPDSGVRAAVLADPDLAERQKQVLLEIYESFRRESAPAGATDAAAGAVTARVVTTGAAASGAAVDGMASPEPAGAADGPEGTAPARPGADAPARTAKRGSAR
jgi:transcriptional regulator with XRE-family HTH domain